MKKVIFIIVACIFLFANNSQTIKNLIGEDKFNTYYELLKPILNEKSLTKTLEYLQNNGLLDIFFDKPKLIHPTFIFTNNNPIFNTKTLYSTLKSLGYYYFYPTKITKNGNYTITLEMKSTHYIDPLLFSKSIEQKGCNVISINKNGSYIYTIDCENEHIDTLKIVNKKIKLLNAKGIYWLDPNGFNKVIVYSSKLDNWYPYIVFFDKNLNILNIISKENSQNTVYLNIPPECAYIKITDTFSKENFKRGIFIKGIK
ncbi:conserved hypothetical protein [Nautilia profundicola AmH]|uniref:Periplasmic protein n=1 Tax=Nautilia profundicola (strain ATCC BAA-1463 / DSM 18972 / AmH) TaxID=598659 RepID=B9L8D0_NAUPA|nr:hypothetical protein [Nautilia profundicola]ACM93523.1 conserved hypothetical protein [Nautilia profundicola AmH]